MVCATTESETKNDYFFCLKNNVVILAVLRLSVLTINQNKRFQLK